MGNTWKILFIVFFSSCKGEKASEAEIAPIASAFVVETVDYIDSLYGITGDEYFDLKPSVNWDRYSDLFEVYDTEPISVFTYGKFGFMKFKDSLSATNNFENLFNYARDQTGPMTDDEIFKYESIISKGGITYWLTNDYIVWKYGQCMTTHEIAITKSDEMKNHFLKGQEIESPHFIRYCCGCKSAYRSTYE